MAADEGGNSLEPWLAKPEGLSRQYLLLFGCGGIVSDRG